jgi:hypothetical protein
MKHTPYLHGNVWQFQESQKSTDRDHLNQEHDPSVEGILLTVSIGTSASKPMNVDARSTLIVETHT